MSSKAVAVRPDGRIVTTGYARRGTGTDFVLARFLPSGQPDAAFGAGGAVVTDVGAARSDYAYSLALLPDGRAVAAGATGNAADYTDTDVALARYDASGVLDATFGSSGLVTTDGVAAGYDEGLAVAVQPDGRISSQARRAASARCLASHGQLLLARFSPGGALDASFGPGGVAAGIPTATARAVEVLPDGRIVVAGAFLQTADRSCFGLARFTPDGVLDTAFGSDGVVTVCGAGGFAEARGVRALPEGDLLAVGTLTSVSSSGLGFTLVRLSPAGVVRTVTRVSFRPNPSGGDFILGTATAVALDPSGRAVVSGVAANDMHSGGMCPVLMRLTPAGVPDPTFGTNGKVVAGAVCGQTTGEFDAVAALPDGSVAAGGVTDTGSSTRRPMLARFTPAGTLDAGFGTNGIVRPGSVLERVAGIVVDASGRVVVAGRTNTNISDITVIRYTPYGLPDAAFGTGGNVQVDVAGGSHGRGLALTTDGGVLAVGAAGLSASVNLGLVRLGGGAGTPTDPAAGAAGLSLGAFPNPAAGRLSVRYTLPQAGTARLSLTDVLGREVAVLLDGGAPAGDGEAALDTSRLAPGVYVLRLAVGAAVAALRVTVAR